MSASIRLLVLIFPLGGGHPWTLHATSQMLSNLGKYRVFKAARTVYRLHFAKTRKMERICNVRCQDGEERMQISFTFGLENKKDRSFNLDRLQTEELRIALGRISNNVVKSLNKKKKKKDQPEETPIEVQLLKGADTVALTTPNKEAWSQGNQLKVADITYNIEVNAPVINKITLPDTIMAGFPVHPKIDFSFSCLKDSQFIWSRCKSKINDTATAMASNDNQPAQPLVEDQNEAWEEVSRELLFTPANTDIGYKVRLVCTPMLKDRSGPAFEVVSKVAVEAGPGHCPFQTRHLFTQNLTDTNSIRIVCYNILADLYADSEYSRTVLFPYCPPYALAFDYRKQLILKELLGYNADIVCLQECDYKFFLHGMLDAFDIVGLSGTHCMKGGEVPEGEAIFYRRSKFRFLEEHNTLLVDLLEKDPALTDLKQVVNSNQALTENITDKKTVAQVCVLETVAEPHRKLVVLTTHLYFKPNANNIRLIQALICLRHLQNIAEKHKQNGTLPAVVVCGDLNSGAHTAVHELMTSGRIPADHSDWKIAEDGEAVDGQDFNTPFSLTSACGTPDYTNYTVGFHGCLDWIYVQGNLLQPAEVIPLPSHEEVTQLVAIPNLLFPSDHLALVCEVKWTDSTSEQ